MPGMPLQAVLKDRYGVLPAFGRMERNGVDVGVSRLIGRELDGAAQFIERLLVLFQPDQHETKCMVKPCNLGRGFDRRAKDLTSVAVPTQQPVKVGKIDRRRRELRAQAQGGLEFSRRLQSLPSRAPVRTA